MAKSIKSELDKYLKQLSKADLEKEVKKMYTKIKAVKDFYEMELSTDTTAIVNKYKEKIKNEYFPKRGFGKARNSVSRKVVNDFKKIAVFSKDVIELLLYRVEMMIAFTSEYGDIDEPFYNSLESSFHEACKLIAKENLEQKFAEKCEELVESTSDFGWGLYDGLSSSYEEFLVDG